MVTVLSFTRVYGFFSPIHTNTSPLFLTHARRYVGIRDPPRKSLAHEIPDTLPFLPPRQPDATNANTTIPQILDLTRNTQQQLNEMASQSMRLHPFSFDSSLLEDPPGALQDRLAIFSGQKRAEQLGLIRKGANTAAPASLPSSTVPPPVHLAKAVVEEVVNQHGGNGNDDDEDYDDGEIQLTSSSS